MTGHGNLLQTWLELASNAASTIPWAKHPEMQGKKKACMTLASLLFVSACHEEAPLLSPCLSDVLPKCRVLNHHKLTYLKLYNRISFP